MTRLAIAYGLPSLAAMLLVTRRGEIRRALGDVPLAAGLGIGVASLVWWALLLAPGLARSSRIALDAAVSGLAVAVAWALRRRAGTSPSGSRVRATGPAWIAFAFCLPFAVLAVGSVVAATAIHPHGTWDAWAIWNLRARFLARGLPDAWRDGFSSSLQWSHPDYPLLLPLSVARGWMYAGSETTAVPAFLSAVFGAAVVLTAAVSVARSRGAARGWIAAAAIMAAPAFVEQASGQIADVPLSFYILASFVLLYRAVHVPVDRGGWVLAGVAAGLAAWTKNEGLLFLVVFTCAAAWCSIRAGGLRALDRVAFVLCGAAPALVALAVLKWRIAAPDLLVASQSPEHIAASLADTLRIRVAGAALARELWFGGADRIGVLPIVAGYALINGVRRPSGVPAVAAVSMLVMLLGYWTVYVVTPYDFAWHVRTSVERVVLHLFPTLVWSMLIAAGGQDDGSGTRDGSGTLGSFRVRAEPDVKDHDLWTNR